MSNHVRTVGELKRALEFASDDAPLTFSGGLGFYRVRTWDDGSVFVEFDEPQADLSPEFRRLNPHIKVAFVNVDA